MGHFYEIYGYSPEFIGDGWKCAQQLVNVHPDKFEISNQPKIGAIHSGLSRNHVGIVIGYDGKINTFQQAKKDWGTHSYPLEQFISKYIGVVFANPK